MNYNTLIPKKTERYIYGYVLKSIYKYENKTMTLKQISLTMPEALFKASKDYSKEFGYRSLQEFIVELIRKKVIIENYERYKEIEERMKKEKGVKKFSQKDAIKHVKAL